VRRTSRPTADGTGAYNGARGTALVTDVSKTKATIEIGLL
jgi:hypothetical protein